MDLPKDLRVVGLRCELLFIFRRQMFNPSLTAASTDPGPANIGASRYTVISCDITVQRLCPKFIHKLCLIREKDVPGSLLYIGFA